MQKKKNRRIPACIIKKLHACSLSFLNVVSIHISDGEHRRQRTRNTATAAEQRRDPASHRARGDGGEGGTKGGRGCHALNWHRGARGGGERSQSALHSFDLALYHDVAVSVSSSSSSSSASRVYIRKLFTTHTETCNFVSQSLVNRAKRDFPLFVFYFPPLSISFLSEMARVMSLIAIVFIAA